MSFPHVEAMAAACARGQKDELGIGELQALVEQVTATRGTMGYANDVLGILRRHQDARLSAAAAKVGRATREGRPLLASEARDVEKARTEAGSIRDLIVRVDEARALENHIPESQRTAPRGEAAARAFLPSLREYEARAMSVGSDSAGGYLAPEQQSTVFFDRLRANSIMLNIGIPLLPMDGYDMNVPGLSGSATASTFAENAEITASTLTIKAVKLTARKLGCLVVASREVMADARPDLREIISRDLVSTMGLALDAGLLSGDGSGSSLTGLRNLAGVTVTTLGTGSGGFIQLDDIANAVSRMRANNAQPGAIVMHPRTEAQIRLLKDGDGHYLWQPSVASEVAARLFGLPIFTSSQVSVTENVGGSATKSWLAVVDPQQLVIGQRATVELLYDPYSKSSFDQVLIRATARFAGLGVLNAAGVEIVAGINESA